MVAGEIVENYVRNLGNCILSCWSEENPSSNALENDKNVINDATKFSVSVDVSLYKPEELRVHINGREIIVEGNQEKPCDSGYAQRSFMNRWTLPDDADLDAVETSLTEQGRLVIETPKTGLHTLKREVPIKYTPKETTTTIPYTPKDSTTTVPSSVVVIN